MCDVWTICGVCVCVFDRDSGCARRKHSSHERRTECRRVCVRTHSATTRARVSDAPRLFKMGPESGGGSYGFTHDRLELARKTLAAEAASIDVGGFKELFTTRPILVYPGKPTGRTLMSMVAEIPPEGSPTLHLTPDSPSAHPHAMFEF